MDDHFWKKPYPSLLFFSTTFATKIIGTLFAVYGIFLVPIGWKYALWIWAYALAWFVFNDFVKVWVYKLLAGTKSWPRRPWLLFNLVSRTRELLMTFTIFPGSRTIVRPYPLNCIQECLIFRKGTVDNITAGG